MQCITTHITIFRFPMAEAAAKSRGEGKSPKLVSSDHCHISGRNINSNNCQCNKKRALSKCYAKQVKSTALHFIIIMNLNLCTNRALFLTSVKDPKVSQPADQGLSQ